MATVVVNARDPFIEQDEANQSFAVYTFEIILHNHIDPSFPPKVHTIHCRYHDMSELRQQLLLDEIVSTKIARINFPAKTINKAHGVKERVIASRKEGLRNWLCDVVKAVGVAHAMVAEFVKIHSPKLSAIITPAM
jgi:hypothetical protein